MERWDVAFADLYLDALEVEQAGGRPPEPWAIAFGAARERQLPPLRHVLLGMNAHINFDLAHSLLAVITDQELDDPELVARREADHRHVDEVLVARVAAEDAELAAARVADLVAPGQVVLKLAVLGFGVRLPEAAG
ncbi:MAG TPA: DUF5995 family protein [Actinomycetota bacterium]|nr:DUF5995 family protein [Actinomycetota bacterium]